MWSGGVSIEKPIDPYNPDLSAQRQAQLDRYIRGETLFAGQWYDGRALLEASLANVLRAFGLPDHRAVIDDCPLAEIPLPLSEDDYGRGISFDEQGNHQTV